MERLRTGGEVNPVARLGRSRLSVGLHLSPTLISREFQLVWKAEINLMHALLVPSDMVRAKPLNVVHTREQGTRDALPHTRGSSTV